MSLADFLFGRKEKLQQVPTMAPEQQQYLSQLLGGLGMPTRQGFGYLSDILSEKPELMGQFEAPYLREYREQEIPRLAELFSSGLGGGGLGAQQSSAFGQALGSQAAGLQERLAAMRAGLKQSALQQLMDFGQMGLGTRGFENVYRPATTGFMGAMAPGIGSAFGMGAMGGLSRLFGGF